MPSSATGASPSVTPSRSSRTSCSARRRPVPATARARASASAAASSSPPRGSSAASTTRRRSGFGLDLGHYYGSLAFNGYRDQCLHFEPGPNGTSVCTEVTSNGGTYNYLFIPAVLQWNFWFTDRLSAFGEPGVNLFFLGNHGFGVGPAFYVGGRIRVADRITITARIGYPTVGIGVSFMM